MAPLISKWHRELELFAGLKPMLIISGGTMDKYRYPVPGSVGEDTLAPLPLYLHGFFSDLGYEQVVFYSNLIGFMNPYAPAMTESFAAMTGSSVQSGAIPAEFKGNAADTAPNLIRRAMAQKEQASVVILESVSHYIVSPDRMDQHDVNSFNLLLTAAAGAQQASTPSGNKLNLIVILCDKLNDLPAWLYLNNPLCKTIQLESPDREERKRLISGPTFAAFFDSAVYRRDMPFYNDHPDELERLREKFVGVTEGMTFTELDALRCLCRREAIAVRDLCTAVDLYKYGVRENPWNTLSLDSLRTAKQDFEKRVKGQNAALERTLDVVKRAVTGMSGLSSSSGQKPKGVLFYAGPTGVGKTETAKALAEKLFGAESACIRFDMSEYSQSHADQKLMGAPPGYVGYEAGGQLTNAVRKNPFAILLFDEIEKAHPSILDKFLQILEDGRLTDGQGSTVYFSETIIIFTSNLGIYVKDALGRRQPNVTADMTYPEVERAIRTAVEDYFKLELGRPEILNRIGENIVVFDFIRREAAAHILRAQVDKIIRRMQELRDVRITVTDEAYAQLSEAALADLSNGGRGIGNQVESLLINPLSRWLFDHGVTGSSAVTITRFDPAAMPPAIDCALTEEATNA